MNLVHDVSCSNQSHLTMRRCDSVLTWSMSIGAELFSHAYVCSKCCFDLFVSFRHLPARKMFIFLTDRKEAVLNVHVRSCSLEMGQHFRIWQSCVYVANIHVPISNLKKCLAFDRPPNAMGLSDNI